MAKNENVGVQQAMINAVHPDYGQRSFTETEWNMMPETKYGWVKKANEPAVLKSQQNKEKAVTGARKEVETAEKNVEKLRKKSDDADAKYVELVATQSTDPEGFAKNEPKVKQAKDDANRALIEAQNELQKANNNLLLAEQV